MRKNLKKIGRSILSSIFCLTILMSGLCFFDIGSVISAALFSKSSNTLAAAGSTTAYPSVYFIVPEAIYLKPSITSCTANESAQFQWFVGQTASFNTSTKVMTTTKQTGEKSSGNLYFYYANASSVNVSFRWVNSSLSTYSSSSAGSGAYINVGGAQLNCMNYSSTAAKSFTYSTNMVTAALTTASYSPTLSTSETGCYIEWHATFTDIVDGYSKTVTAYTYVYKPAIQPVGVGLRIENTGGTNHYGQDLAWISGIHRFNTDGNRYPNSKLGVKNIVPFSSSNSSGVKLGAAGTTLYAQFANSTVGNGYFYYTASNNACEDWLNNDSNNTNRPYTDYKTFNYQNYEGGNAGIFFSNDSSCYLVVTAPTSKIYVDVSRYTNLNQIPNLTAGLMVTEDKDSDSNSGAWYVGDCTGKTDSVSGGNWEENTYNTAKALYNNYKALFANQGTFDSRGGYEAEGVKYNGPINISIGTGSGTSTYKIRTAYHNRQGDDAITNIGIMPLDVIADNKETLRTAVEKAKNNFAVLGIYNDSYNSYYFTSTAYTNFVNLYKSAERYLTAVDKPLSEINSSYTSASALATDLENALNTLLAGNSLATKTAYQYNVGLRPTSNGTYELISFPTNQLAYTARDNVTFTPDSTCFGYNNYLGSTKVTSAQGSYFTNTGASVGTAANSLDSIKSALISSSNVNQYSATWSSSVLTIANGNTAHTTKPKTVSSASSGYASEITYNYTAAAKDIAIYMISFYVGNTYTINYNLNGGTSGSKAPTSATYDVPFAVSPPTRSGYKFVGWTVTSGLDNSTAKYGNTSSPSTAISSSTLKCYNTTNSTGSDVYFSNLTPTNNGSVTLTANWIPILDLNWKFNGTDYNEGDKDKARANIYVNNEPVALGVPDFSDGIEPGATVRVSVDIFEPGWSFTNPSEGKDYIEFTMPSTPYVVRPELCSKYTVVFNGNGNTGGSTASQAFIWGTAQNLNANGFTKTGYTFASWNTAANGSGTSYSDKQSVNSLTTDLNGTVNLYAQWSANTITLKYNLNGGTSTLPADSTFKYDSSVTTAATPTREHTITYNANDGTVSPGSAKATYNFNGWISSANGNTYNASTAYTDSFGATSGTVTLTAQWSGGAVTLPTPTRTGYTFAGWYDAASGGNKIGDAGASYTVTANKTVYAHWTANKYTITFDQKGGSGGSASAIATYDSAMPAATMPSKTGYTFQGYFTDTDGKGTQYYNANGTSANNWNIAKDNRTLYADWTNDTYTVTLDMQGGTGGTASVQATYDKAMPEATMPTRTGYSFQGYFTGTDGKDTQYYNADGTSANNWNIDENRTLYAKWTAKTYKVTFDKQGGTDGTDTTTATYDEAMPSVTKPTRTGYIFGGYYTGTDGTGTQYYNADGTSANNWNIDGDTMLYAYWTNGTYTVTLDMQNGTGGTERVQATYDKAMPEATMPTRTGYTFGGYYSEKNGGGTQYYTDKGKSANNWNIDSDTTLYAKWTAISYTVAYDLDGGTAGGTYPTSATYDSAYLLSAPSRNGWTFAGWILLDSDANFLTAKYGDNANEFLSFSSGKKTAIAADIYFKNLASVNGNSVTLKAIWQKKGIVYFNYLNASSEKQTTTVDFSFTTDSPSVEVNIPNVASSVIYDGRTFTMRGWKQSYLPSDPATVSSDSTTVTVDSTGYADVGDVYVNYYAMYDCDVTLSYNVNGGNSAAPASESKKQYINPTDKTEADSIAYTTLSFSVTNIVPTHEKNLTFIGWSTTKDGAVEYIGSSTITIKVNTTLYAVWINSVSAEDELKKQQYIQMVVTYGYNAVTDEVLTHKLTETFDGWDPTDYIAYYNSIDNFKDAKQKYEDNPSSIDSIQKYQQAVIALNKATSTLSEKSVVSSFLENMTIIYKDGEETKKIENASVKDINLNHYSTATLDVLNKNYVEAKKLLEKKLPSQSELNSFVVELAKNYTSYDDIGSKPTVDFYETPSSVAAMLGESSDVEAVNYVYSGKGGYTYYCYVNSKTPKVVLNAVEESEILKSEIETASTTSTRLGYPTRATVTSSGGASAVTTKHLDSSDYSNYINAGIGSNYSGYVNGELLTGEYYYNAYTQIMLSPVFTSDKQEIVYTIKATDDALVKNTESNSFATDINYAATANMSGTTPTTVSKMTTALSDPSQGITICFCYHNPGSSFDVTGDQVQNDKYLNQYHLFRQSGGASNWELPKTGDPEYTVNDGTYKQTDRGSFTFTFNLGSSVDLKSRMKDKNGNDIGPLPTLNTTDAKKIAELFNVNSNYDEAKKALFVGAKYWTKESNGTRVQHEGSGLGYQVWGNNWSFNYYPKSESYTYVHLVDRWGNVVDKVFYVGKQDINEVIVSTASADGAYTILEDGGSGIDTLSLNAGTLEILTDENSTLENNVYRTTGNTVRISTGEANKAYTLTMTDKATNSSTATVTSDENGIITLSVEDTAYESGIYTFMLNSIEVNLYDGVDKYVLSVSGDEVDEGETAQITVTTKGDVSKLRFTDESGNTSTVSSFVQNDDGTRTWTFAKARPAGEYTYKITVKVGYEWLDEGDTATLIFNERILDSGKVRSAEYDEETGLYKVTFEGRATKVQFVSEDGMTRTYTRYAEAVKSKKTYDADGNEVNDTARTLDHEVWYVEARLYSGQNYTVVGKFEAGWNRAEDAASTVTGK